ncbi:YgiT-type zinc finger protein [Acetivibrio cellulolyticus]|uniref:YgiT-type zinc finger protein n=1 Tax=Acetivibrio cellulolyticus TaxID=35830 RepID=UPI0001E2F586|nr:YgiT-type zinc finger protein [Acetivibrio cellulolyticus]
MKCKDCKSKMVKRTNTVNYEFKGQLFTVYNTPVLFCEQCGTELIEKGTKANLDRYCAASKINTINYAKLKEQDDAASVAASSSMLM